MNLVELRIPIRYKELYKETEVPSIETYARTVEMKYIMEKLDENTYEKLFIMFTSGEFSKDIFYSVLNKVEELSVEYTKLHGFKGEIPPMKDNNVELYFPLELQRQFEKVLFSSSILISFYDRKMNLDKFIYNTFWRFFDRKYESNIRKKVSTYVSSQLASISVDSRYWQVAELHGVSPYSWYQRTISDLTSKSLMKLDLDKSYAIYAQVVARDSLMYITKQKFKPVSLETTISSKILYDAEPRWHLNMMIVEDEVSRFFRKNKHILDIEVSEKYSMISTLLTSIALDEILDMSADVMIQLPSVKRDVYFKKIGFAYFKKNRLLVLADIIKTGENTQRTTGNFRIFKHDDVDDSTMKQFNKIAKSIFDNSGNFTPAEVRTDLQNFLNRILVKPEMSLEDFIDF